MDSFSCKNTSINGSNHLQYNWVVNHMRISINTDIAMPIEQVWEMYITPKHVDGWNHASEDWETVGSTSDFRVGGFFKYPMRAKDGSFGFDFEGEFLQIEPYKYIKYRLLDDRVVEIKFNQMQQSVHIEVIFEGESENSVELQRAGWQQILESFKHYCLAL